MKRECDSLTAIVEKKKAELLKRVSDEYQDKLGELNDAMHLCEHVLLQGDGLAEFTQEALKEDNPATFLQVSATVYSTSGNSSYNASNELVGLHKELWSNITQSHPLHVNIDLSSVINSYKH